MKIVIASLLAVALSGCIGSDENSKPAYGKDSGLPANCRAYVQTVIESIRTHKHTVDESLNALERNCGIHGQLWGYKP